MTILVIGSTSQAQEVSRKFGDKHQYHFADRVTADAAADVAFDFVSPRNPAGIELYRGQSLPVFLDTAEMTISALPRGNSPIRAFGFCGLPTFIDRPLFEVTLARTEDGEVLKKICEDLQTGFRIVEDRVGMVTPRVICMVINEAFATVEEGTASREDVDLAMKLGTNYPFGPFEWGKAIGLKKVVSLLDAIYAATRDERYIVCKKLRLESEKS